MHKHMPVESDGTGDGHIGTGWAGPATEVVFPLADLPPQLFSEVLQRAGLHTRQVCRAFRALHPPLLALTPHGLPDWQLLSGALKDLSPNLTSLNLSAASTDCPGFMSIDLASVALLSQVMPRLQHLALPPIHATAFPRMFVALQGLPRLHSLHIPPADLPHLPPHNAVPCFMPLLHPPLAPRLRSLTLPTDALPDLSNAPPRTLHQLTSITFQGTLRQFIIGSSSTPAVNSFASFAAVAPALQSLALWDTTPRRVVGPPTASHLTEFTALTALTLVSVHTPDAGGDARLLENVAAATTLRSLSLNRICRQWTDAHAHALSSLTQLSRLDLAIRSLAPQDWQAPAAAAGQQPAVSAEGVDVAPLLGAPPGWEQDGGQPLDEDVPHPPLLGGLDGGVQGSGHAQGVGPPDDRLAVRDTVALAASTIAALPALQDLSWNLSCGGWTNMQPAMQYWLPAGRRRRLFHWLAAATHLRRLRLSCMPVPAAEAHVLSSLRALTCLRLEQCQTAHAGSCAGPPCGISWWPVALTNLRELAFNYHKHETGSDAAARDLPEGPCPAPLLAMIRAGAPWQFQAAACLAMIPAGAPWQLQVAACLPCLHTLSLRGFCCPDPQQQAAAHLPAVLAGLRGVLVRLDLASAFVDEAVLYEMGAMARLEVLDLYGVRHARQPVPVPLESLAPHLALPHSLRRCYVTQDRQRNQAGVVRELRGRHPQVDFWLGPRRDTHAW